jgi:flagellar motor switch protein FliN/FliY
MKAPLEWVRQIASEVPQLNEIPLFGNAPPFDWHSLSSALSKIFAVSQLEIRAGKGSQHEGAAIKKGLGANALTFPIHIAPLGTVFWMLSHEDMVQLATRMLQPEEEAVSSEILQEGFVRYLALEALHKVQEMAPFKKLTLQMSEEEFSFEKAFCVDIEIEINRKSCWGRLVIPTEFRTAWVSHFSESPREYVSSDLAKKTEVVVGIKTGSVILSQDEWAGVQAGDFILLDQGSYDPTQEEGIAMLMLHSTPLFNVKIKKDAVELSDYALYYDDTMGVEKDSEETTSVDPLPLRELPIYITVEMARIKMSLDYLMHLNPGHTLELPINPEGGVSLMLRGKKAGRAEIVHLGEKLALRLLEIG